MQRSNRIVIARQTVEICEVGWYTTANGRRVNIGDDLAKAKSGTVLCSPGIEPTIQPKERRSSTKLETSNETTFAALRRLAGTSGHLACLNFASAKNPGGGFLGGALAQEEALACASGLYPCLLQIPEYYERNRVNRSALYLDLAIFSPNVPFFRDDDGVLEDNPLLASVITAPAPNAGAIALNEPANSHLVEPTFQRRAEMVLTIAEAQKVDLLVLGAWGCGVFRNDPRVVATIFEKLLKPPGRFAGAFEQVVFAVFDRSQGRETYKAFAERLMTGGRLSKP